jgi:hypothetical protein
MYPLKAIDWGRQARQHLNGGETLQSAPLHYVGTPCSGAELERSGSFATGVYCGAGFMLIRRRAIERMIAAYPQTRYETIHAHTNARGAVNYALFDCFIDAHTGTYLSEVVPQMARHWGQDLARHRGRAQPRWFARFCG